MIRIRYKKENGILTTVKPILCNNKFAEIVLNTLNMQYQLIDTNTKEVLAQGNSPTIHGLKRSAKAAAQSIGASFYQEVRNTNSERKLNINE